ncbi:hypothetical protein M422DRAFT_223267 [Sphaerobolus stellatus SS14]|nr:hypothetical protein M422DRAFT_223267 [Sphaerobolus stellatus SS14]
MPAPTTKPKKSVSFAGAVSGKGKRKLSESNADNTSQAKVAPTSTEKPSKKPRKDKETVVAPAKFKSESKAKAKDVEVSSTKKDSEPKKSKKKAAVVPEPEVADEEEAAAAEDNEEEEIALEGFSSESDSSDEELEVDEPAGVDVSKLPSFAKDDASVKRRLEKAKKNPAAERGVVYLGRIPHGFYEDQMRGYFSQFGEVTRLRLSRNKKTGRSKHYGFIEFASAEVAEIVSDTMNNYLLLGHILQCTVIPKDQVHPELWVGANKKWRFVPRDRLARERQNMPRTIEQQKRADSRLLARQKKKQAKLAEAGIDYDMSAVAYKPSS